jgi:hypothetical protein
VSSESEEVRGEAFRGRLRKRWTLHRLLRSFKSTSHNHGSTISGHPPPRSRARPTDNERRKSDEWSMARRTLHYILSSSAARRQRPSSRLPQTELVGRLLPISNHMSSDTLSAVYLWQLDATDQQSQSLCIQPWKSQVVDREAFTTR